MVKIVLLLLRIFSKFIRGKYVNFSVFEIFNDTTFFDYLKATMNLSFEVFDYVNLLILKLKIKVFQYTKLTELFIENIKLVSDYFLETLFS